MRNVLVLILMSLFSSVAVAQEKLEYNLKVLDSDYGTATLYTNGNKLFGEIRANEKWSSIFNVHNTIASELDKQGTPKLTEFSYKFTKSEGRYKISFGNKRIKVSGSKNKDSLMRTKAYLKGDKPMHDALSWVGGIRRKLKSGEGVGFPLTFKVFSGSKFYNVSCEPLPQQVLVTGLGEKMTQPYLVKVTRKNKFKREMTVWFNLDSKTNSFEPLRVQGKFKLGLAEANIISISSREGEKAK